MVGYHLVAILDHVTCQIRLSGVGAPLESAGKTNQASGAESLAQRILTRTPNLPSDGDRGRIQLVAVPVNEYPVLGFKNDVVFIVAFERLGQVHADDVKFTVTRLAEDLSIIEQCVTRRSASQVNCIA